MFRLEAHIPGQDEPGDLQSLVEHFVNSNGPHTPDYLQFDSPEFGVEAVREEVD